MKNNIIPAVIAVVVSVIATTIVLTLTPAKTTTVTQQTDQNQNYGSVTSPNIASPWISFGGVTRYSYRQSFQASSTLCAIQNPLNASTTLEFAEMNFATSSAYSNLYEIGESATQNATTTALVTKYTIGSFIGAPAVINATSSVTSLTDSIVPPLGWINFNVSTSSTGVNQAVGDCEAGFRTL